MNFAGDSYSTAQLNNAYAAAKAAGNFKLFLSFDYEGNKGFQDSGDPSRYAPFTADNVTAYINKYKGESAQFLYDSKPLVSTFEGTEHASDWSAIQANTGCFFVPSWTSKKGSPNFFSGVNGVLSWDVWPNGPTGISEIIDNDWRKIIGSEKSYMIGVAPWFYTNLPGKNWLWRGDNLWHDRWQQVVEIQPELVEVC